MIEPGKAAAIMRVVGSDVRAGVDFEEGADDALTLAGGEPYRIVDGMAIVPVAGTLFHQWNSVRPNSGATGYDGLRLCIQRALADEDVDAIVFEIDSPGGMVSGLDEVASLIRESSKPTAAYVDAMAFSAAYYIASQADQIVLTPSGQVGSIGSLILHLDQSAALESNGLKYTFIHSGEHKVDGNSLEPLSDNARGEFQRAVDEARAEFAEAVGMGRGERFTAQQALETEARVFNASDALEMGMVDAVARPDQALTRISELLEISSDNPGGGPMALDKTGDEARAEAQADVDKVKAEAIEEANRIKAEAEREANDIRAKAAADAERTRAIEAMDVKDSIKDKLKSEAFSGVPVESLSDLVEAMPKSLAEQMQAEGGAGVDPDPSEAMDTGAKAQAKASADAAREAAHETLKNKGATI